MSPYRSEQLFDVSTAWGTAVLRVVKDTVVGIEPPVNQTAARARTTPTRHVAQQGAQVATTVTALGTRLAAYFDGADIELASSSEVDHWLDAAGIDGFHRRALLTLHGLPRGRTVTYGELAELAGSPRAARAVGTACATNPLPIVIPCHRVLPASGGLGRYGRLGPSYKRKLLELEGWQEA